jgi:outer membrane protein OmpA-like peptidoglycan-associated protein
MKVRIAVFALSLASSGASAATDLNIAPGFITTSVIHDGVDYEAINVLQQLDAKGLKRVVRWSQVDATAPGGRKEHSATFVTALSDLESAPRSITVWISGDPETMPGATQGMVSRAVWRSLVGKGESPIVLGTARATHPGDLLGGLLAGRKYYRGTLRRLEAGSIPYKVIVNGQSTTLPAVHVKGTVSVGSDSGTAELWILDDERLPTLLRWEILGSSLTIVRIDTPPKDKGGAGAAGGIDLGNALSQHDGCHSELHGVYFTSGSAQLLPESRPALEGVAAALRQHPDWSVLIEGHTDNLGNAESNLSLSRARAAAVRTALINDLKIEASRLSSEGFGMTRPIETNATLEGRARNRRVELSRKCN